MKRGSLGTSCKFNALYLATLLLCWTVPSLSQLSGYSSVGYGYHQNPLGNYESLSDQTKQAYVELAYDLEGEYSTFGLRYVGGLMAFNRFRDRNFYEHSLAATYSMRFEKSEPDTTESEEESEDTTAVTTASQEEPSQRDSTDQFLSLTLKIGARHDGSQHLEFDNQGAELAATYRSSLGQYMYGRLTNQLALRQYPNVSELSNAVDQLSGEIGMWTESGLTYGTIGSVGVKYYTTSSYDTTQFESTRTFTVNPAGKGKPGGKQVSGKSILVQPKANGTVQLAGALFIRKDWSSKSSILASVLYRWDARAAVRYLAQRTTASTLNEDIYNDFYSYQGPELKARLTQPLVAGVQLIVEAEIFSKRFEAPALTLEGVNTGDNRKDLRSSIEVYASRYVGLWNNFGMDLSISATLARNQSNDSYNDYSFQAVSVGLGIGF